MSVHPTNVSTAAQHSTHLAPRQFLFNIVVLQKKPVSRLLYASDDALWLRETRPKNSQKLDSRTAWSLDADSICVAMLNVLACVLRTELPQARALDTCKCPLVFASAT
jgi:hypothetical protein